MSAYDTCGKITSDGIGMYSDSPKYVKKKKKSAHVSADFEKLGLVLDYEVQVTLVGDNGSTMKRQYDSRQKFIPLEKVLNEYTDVKALSRQIVEASDLIPEGRLDHVKGLVQQLKEECVHRSRRADSDIKVRRDYKQKKRAEKEEALRRQREEEAIVKARQDAQNASLEELESYVNQFYEDDMQSKLTATSMVMALASRPANLDELRTAMDGALIRALVRLLGDNYKRSMDLVINILTIFYYFSNFWEFHNTLMNDRVGTLTLKIIEWHHGRYKTQKTEIDQIRKDLQEVKISRTENEYVEEKVSSLEMDLRKAQLFIQKQSKLFILSFKVLLNLAEDIQVERKMYKKSISELLIGMLESENQDLITLCVTFLKKLSVFRENKDEMVRLNLVSKCAAFFPDSDEKLMMVALRTIFNLSYDDEARDQLVKSSMIPKLVEMLRKPKFRAIVLRILYHMSAEDSCKSMFSYTEPPAIPIVMQLIVNFPNKIVPKELAALAVNLSLNSHNAKLMCQKGGLKSLTERVIRCQDPVLAKILKNISKITMSEQEDEACKTSGDSMETEEKSKSTTSSGESMWSPMVESLTKLATETDNSDLLVELLGILGNITPKDLPKNKAFSDLMIRFSLIEFIHKHLVPGFSKEDVVLQLIIYVGNLCLDEEAARMLSNSPVIKLCYDLLHEKRNDQEIVLQILFAFYRLLRHKGTSTALLFETQMPRDVCSLLQHKNPMVSVMADSVLELVIDHDEENENEKANRLHTSSALSEAHLLRGRNSKMIREIRFRLHNKKWLDIMVHEDDEESDSCDDTGDYRSEDAPDFSPSPSGPGATFKHSDLKSPSQLSHSGGDYEEAHAAFDFKSDDDDDFISNYRSY